MALISSGAPRNSSFRLRAIQPGKPAYTHTLELQIVYIQMSSIYPELILIDTATAQRFDPVDKAVSSASVCTLELPAHHRMPTRSSSRLVLVEPEHIP